MGCRTSLANQPSSNHDVYSVHSGNKTTWSFYSSPPTLFVDFVLTALTRILPNKGEKVCSKWPRCVLLLPMSPKFICDTLRSVYFAQLPFKIVFLCGAIFVNAALSYRNR